MNKIPVIVTVSRETGQVIDVQRAEADRESFRKICQALISRGVGKEERETCQDGKRTE